MECMVLKCIFAEGPNGDAVNSPSLNAEVENVYGTTLPYFIIHDEEDIINEGLNN
jgi:hypothetical protein